MPPMISRITAWKSPDERRLELDALREHHHAVRSPVTAWRPDRSLPHHAIIAHEAGELPGGHRARGLVELELHSPVVRLAGPAGHGARVVAQPHRLDLLESAVEADVVERHDRSAERLLGPDRHAVRAGVLVDHVKRIGAGDPEPAPLADRVVVLALVRAQHATVEVHDLAGPAQARASVALQELAPAEARDEAEVLTLALVRDR